MSAPETPPRNLDAEESVLGAMLLSPKAIESVSPILGDGAAFYRASHATIYRAALTLHGRGEPVDLVTLADELERRGELEQVGGHVRVNELAVLVPAVSNVARYARIVSRTAAQREAERLLARGLSVEACRAAADRLALVEEGRPGRFPGLDHAGLLSAKIASPSFLVEGIIERGTLGLIVGLPESFKSYLALSLAFRVAAGGQVLGRDVDATGPAGIWVQDGPATRAKWRAIEYARRHGLSEALPIQWHLAEGLRLPDDLADLRAEVEREGQALVVLDSLYNFLSPEVKLADEEAAKVLALLKTEIADATGCVVAVVDHSPWPSEGNRGQRRALGSVFKAALARWTLHAERNDGAVWVESRGNDIDGFRERFVFDADRLELRPVEEERPPERDLAGEIAAVLEERGPEVATEIGKAIGKRRETVEAILEEDLRFVRAPTPPGRNPGKFWTLSDVPVRDSGTGRDRHGEDSLSACLSETPLPPVGGEGSGQAGAESLSGCLSEPASRPSAKAIP